MAKMGRPKKDNPKNHMLTIAFDDNTYEWISSCANANNVSKSEICRRAIMAMKQSTDWFKEEI